MLKKVSISEAARTSGVKVPTIRYYEQIGLLQAPVRTEGNRRTYGSDEVRRLAFIRHSRELGFEIDAIKTLLALQDDPNQSCGTADEIVIARLRDVNQRIRSLNALKVELETMLEECSHGRIRECRVIETLANHDQCIPRFPIV